MSEDTDFNLRCLIAGKKCLYAPSAVVHHKYRASIDAAPALEMTLLAARNEAMVVAKDLPATILILTPVLWPWRLLRQTLPARPSKWHLAPMLVRELPRRLRAESEGLRMGWAKRAAVQRTKAIGTLEIMRWLVYGEGRI